MAGGAGGGRGVVLAQHPLGAVEVQLVLVGAVGDAVLRLLVDLLLRVVGPEVALAAVLGPARLRGREGVALVAGGAGADRAVRVEPAHAGVGPAGGQQGAVLADLHHAAVALLAAVDGQRRAAVEARVALDDVGQEVVERAEDQPGLGVVALVELAHLLLVAAGAVARRDDDADGLPHVLEGVGVAGLGAVALPAADVGPEVLRGAPLLVDAGGLGGVALVALEGLLRKLRRGGLLGYDGGGRKGEQCDPEDRAAMDRHGFLLQVPAAASRCSPILARRRRCGRARTPGTGWAREMA